MRPLFFSVLKFFTDGKEACRSDVQDALRAQYGNFKAFKGSRYGRSSDDSVLQRTDRRKPL